MKKLRAVWRAFWFVALLLGWGALYVCSRLIVRNAAQARRWRTWAVQRWARSTAAMCGMKIVQHGQAPVAPYFLVFNHLSYADIVPLMATLQHPMMVARHDFASWPVIGALASAFGAIWVKRGDFSAMPDVTRQMREAMHSGYGVVMAPEATTTRGDKVYPFHGTLLQPAVELGVPVHYCALRFETAPDDPPAWQVVNWWELISFPAHAWRLMHLKQVTATITFGEQPIAESNRKLLAKRLHEAVSAIYVPMAPLA